MVAPRLPLLVVVVGLVPLSGLLWSSWWVAEVAVEQVSPVHVFAAGCGCQGGGLALLLMLPPSGVMKAMCFQPPLDAILLGFVACGVAPPPSCLRVGRALLGVRRHGPPQV